MTSSPWLLKKVGTRKSLQSTKASSAITRHSSRWHSIVLAVSSWRMKVRRVYSLTKAENIDAWNWHPTVEFEDSTSEAFGLFVRWLYRNSIRNDKSELPQTHLMVKLWVLGDKILAAGVQNAAIRGKTIRSILNYIDMFLVRLLDGLRTLRISTGS